MIYENRVRDFFSRETGLVPKNCDNCGNESLNFFKNEEYDLVCDECGCVVAQDNIISKIEDHEIYDMKNTSYDPGNVKTIYSTEKYFRKKLDTYMPDRPRNGKVKVFTVLLHTRMIYARDEILRWNKKKFIDTRCFVLFSLYSMHKDYNILEDYELVECLRELKGNMKYPVMRNTYARNFKMWKSMIHYVTIIPLELEWINNKPL